MDLISAGELGAASLARSFCTLLRPKSFGVEALAGTGVAAAGAALTGAAAGVAAAGEEGGAFGEVARPASLS